jgi:hypothetical protein
LRSNGLVNELLKVIAGFGLTAGVACSPVDVQEATPTTCAATTTQSAATTTAQAATTAAQAATTAQATAAAAASTNRDHQVAHRINAQREIVIGFRLRADDQ